MAARVNSPLKTFVLFLLVGGFGWLCYEYVYVRRIFQTQEEKFVPDAELKRVRDAVLETYGNDKCLLELGMVQYRMREGRYRIDIVVDDGCEEQAKRMCQEISEFVEDRIGHEAEVFAYTSGMIQMTRYIP